VLVIAVVTLKSFNLLVRLQLFASNEDFGCIERTGSEYRNGDVCLY